MQYHPLGSTGLKISTLMLGAARFGDIDDDTAARVVDTAIDLGVSTFDTANVYNAGASEEQLGRAIRRHRDRIVLCTKVGLRVGDTEVDFANPNDPAERWHRGIAPTDQGLSRKHVMHAVRDSLRRLGTDYIDLYQVHRFDPDTPIEETVATLDDLVHDGLVRYVGCSGFAAHQLGAALDAADGRDTRFASIQSTYSLISRQAEQELLPLCNDRQVGLLAFGSVAGGMLTGRYSAGNEPGPDTRLGSRQVFKRIYFTDPVLSVVDRLKGVADETGRALSQLAVGWVHAQPGVAAVLLGISRPEQLHDVIDVFERPLTPEELQLLARAIEA
jgi:aryl-alcohol dehydrogenase-like predicted oxidoreductase